MSKEKVSIALIVAMSQNRVIGCDNQLPWYLPNDLKYFKAVTMGKPIIMGRKTFESIGKPLPGRRNIVVTKNQRFNAPGVDVVHSASEALKLGQKLAQAESVQELMVIGGAQLYATMLPNADRLYLTLIHTEVTGDAYFPDIDLSQWIEVEREDFSAEGANPYDYSFLKYNKTAKN